MKRILMSAALVITLATLTGCNSSKTKTLTCTQSKSDNGFTNEEKLVYKLKNNKITTATMTTTIIAEGDYAQYIEDYKTGAKEAADSYNTLNGVSAKVEENGNKVSVVVDFDAEKMSEDDYTLYNMGESYESLNDKLTNAGYTCK